MRLDAGSNNFRTVLLLMLLVGAFTLPPLAALPQTTGKRLAKQDVIDLLTGDVPNERVAVIARDRGVAFEMNAAAEKDIRAAGGSDELISTLRALAPRAPAPVRKTSRTPPPANPGSPAVLMVQSTPGESQVYVDDEPVGSTSHEGRLKLTRIAPGGHQIRVSLAGYDEYVQSVSLSEGETTTVIATLRPPAAPPPPVSHLPQQVETTPPVYPPTAPSVPQTGFATFIVAHDHGQSGQNYCVGTMAVGNGMIYYKSTNGVHNFEIPLNTVKEAKRNAVYLSAMGAFHIRVGKNTNYNFVVLNQQNQFQPPDPILTAINQAIGK